MASKKLTLTAFWRLLKATALKWNDCNAPRLGASLAFYMLLSLAPLLILLVAICGFAFSAATAQERLLADVRNLAGPAGERTMRMLISSAAQPKSGIIATAVALVTLLFGASGVFLELRESLNTIWSAPKQRASGWKAFVRQRLASFGMVLGLSAVLLISFLLSTVLAIFRSFFVDFFPVHIAVAGEVTNLFASVVGIAILFALIFKYVPDVPIDWRDVGIGAFFTAALFTVGKLVLGIYFGTVGVGSTYGAAGSLVALVVWVYYSAQIFFFGAIFTQIYAEEFGSRTLRISPRSLPNPGIPVSSQSA